MGRPRAAGLSAAVMLSIAEHVGLAPSVNRKEVCVGGGHLGLTPAVNKRVFVWKGHAAGFVCVVASGTQLV